MKVSINLVTWNGKKYLPYCLESVAKQTFCDFFLFILDNGSTDGTVEFLKSYKFQIPNYKISFNKENVGFAAGHNRAIRETKGDYVLMLNQDIILEPHFLEEVVEFLDSHPKVGAVTGKLLKWNFAKSAELYGLNAELDRKNLCVEGGKTNFLDSCGLKIFKNHRVIELGGGEKDNVNWDKPQEIFGVSGAAPVYRRKTLEDVAIPKNCVGQDQCEYFDEDFFSYKEDIDLAYRLRLRGWQAWFLPKALAWHDRTAKKSDKEMGVVRRRKNKSTFINYHSYKNHLFFLLKNVPVSIWLRYGFWIKWYEIKKFIYLLFFETETLKAWSEFFKKLPKMWGKRKWIQEHKTIDTSDIVKWLNS